MFRTLLKIMKRNRVIVGLFMILTLSGVVPCPLGVHESRAVAAHQHGPEDLATFAHSPDHGHRSDYSATGAANDCCAPGCPFLIGNTYGESDPVYMQAGRMPHSSDRHVDGFASLTLERPPRA